MGAGGRVSAYGLVVDEDAHPHPGQVEQPVGEGFDGLQPALDAGREVPTRDGEQRRARCQEDDADQRWYLRQGDGQAELAVADRDRLGKSSPDAQCHHGPQLGPVATGRLEVLQLRKIEQRGPGRQHAGQCQGAHHRQLARAPVALSRSCSPLTQRPHSGDGATHLGSRPVATSNSGNVSGPHPTAGRPRIVGAGLCGGAILLFPISLDTNPTDEEESQYGQPAFRGFVPKGGANVPPRFRC